MKIKQIRETLRKEIDEMDDSSLMSFYGLWLNYKNSFITEEHLQARNELAKVRGKVDLEIDLDTLRDRKDLSSQTPPEATKS